MRDVVVTSTLLALLTLLILVARDVIVVELSGVIRKEIHDVSPAHSEAWRRLSSQMTASRHRHAPGMMGAKRGGASGSSGWRQVQR